MRISSLPDDQDPLFVRQLEEQLSACQHRDHRAVLLAGVLTTALSYYARERGRASARAFVKRLDEFLADFPDTPDWPE